MLSPWLGTLRPETRASPAPSGSPQRRKLPKSTAFADGRRFGRMGRWESLGNRQNSKGRRARSASVVADDGQAWGGGFRQHRATRRLGRLSRRNRATSTTAGSATSEARSGSCRLRRWWRQPGGSLREGIARPCAYPCPYSGQKNRAGGAASLAFVRMVQGDRSYLRDSRWPHAVLALGSPRKRVDGP